MAPSEPPSHDRDRDALPLPKPDEVELKRGKVARPPAHPLLQGVYDFPWYQTSLPRWGLLSFLFMLVAALVQFLVGALSGF